MKCTHCGVKPGKPHLRGCEEARCLYNGEQRLSHLGNYLHPGDCGKAIWTGEYAGEAECREYGLWCRWVDAQGYVPCDVDDHGAVVDITALVNLGRWNRILHRWVVDVPGKVW